MAAPGYERDLSDGLTQFERAVLSRWDAGAPIAAIALALGKSRAAIEHVVQLYDDRPDPDERAQLAAANAAMLAALSRASGGDVPRGAAPWCPMLGRVA